VEVRIAAACSFFHTRPLGLHLARYLCSHRLFVRRPEASSGVKQSSRSSLNVRSCSATVRYQPARPGLLRCLTCGSSRSLRSLGRA